MGLQNTKHSQILLSLQKFNLSELITLYFVSLSFQFGTKQRSIAMGVINRRPSDQRIESQLGLEPENPWFKSRLCHGSH